MTGPTANRHPSVADRTGPELAEAHRRAQSGIVAAFLTRFLALWPLLDPNRLDETSPGWVSAVMELIGSYRRQSADLATDYYRAAREQDPTGLDPVRIAPEFTVPDLSVVRTPDRPELPPRIARVFDAVDDTAPRLGRLVAPKIDWSDWDRAARNSLTVTGPVSQKAKTARRDPQGRDKSLVESSGAASRHVRAGERETLLRLVEDDVEALGWMRVTDGDPCAFCAMLASRGPIYKQGSFDRAQVHDACGCSLMPVWSTDTGWPGRGKEFERLWRRSTRGLTGKDAIAAFRRALARQRRDADQPAEPGRVA